MKTFKYILLLLITLLSAEVMAQSRIIGNVADSDGQPLVGATIIVEGSTNGTVTDINGDFALNAKLGTSVTASFVGYQKQSATLNKMEGNRIVLMLDDNTLNEVVVVGYGTMRRSDITGSTGSVHSKDVEEFKSSGVLDAIGGKVAGVQVTSNDGEPGGGFSVRMRGTGTLNGDADPLYIVDGFQVDDLSHISNSDIASIDFLKDASAAAIYGSRAANGVVLVTTKSGEKGKLKVTYGVSTTYRAISKYLDVLSPYEFVKLQVEANPTSSSTYYMQGTDPTTNTAYRYQSLDDYIGVEGIDWQDETFSPTWSQEHNATVSGGNDQFKYYFSLNRYNEDGIFENSGFDRTNIKANFTNKLSNKVSVETRLTYSKIDRSGTGTSADDGRFNMLGMILRARPTGGLSITDEELLGAPIDPVILEDEGGSVAQVNPVIQAEAVTNDRSYEMWIANMAVNIDLGHGFTFKSTGSYTGGYNSYETFYSSDSREAYRNGDTPYGRTQKLNKIRWSNNNVLNWKMRKSRGHSLSAMLGQEIVFSSEESLLAGSTDFPFDNLGNDNLGLGATAEQVSSSYSEQYLVSYFTRGYYNYRDIYYLTVTLRADGSSKFGPNNKWGVFPSASVAWRVSEEEFMKSAKSVSNLKLRVGYGMVGNDRIPDQLYSSLYEQTKYGYGTSTVTGLVSEQIANPDLKWEASVTTNVGVDLGLFKNRLNFTIDGFVKDTKDLLMQQSMSYISGFSYQWQNVGKIRNSGIELAINSTNLSTKSGFVWTTDFNISFVKNKLLSLQSGESAMYAKADWNSLYTNYDYVAYVGGSIGSMYGYVFDGVYQYSDFECSASTGELTLKEGIVDISSHSGVDTTPGMIKYKDIDGDGEITTNDRTVIGNGNADFYGGLTNTFSYKGFDFSFMFQFNYGNEIYNATRMFATETQDLNYNMLAEVADRWTPTNSSNSVPRWDGYVKYDVNSRYVEDGSYLRLKSVSLGYVLPHKWVSKVHIKRLRVYATAQNLFVITNYSGLDPEVNMAYDNPMTPGLDWGAYPKSKVYSLGAEITL